MHRVAKWGLRLLLFLSVVINPFLPGLAGAATDRSYAYAQLTNTGYRGVYAEIETANPTVRDGGFSTEAVWIGGSCSFAEVGWRKEASMSEPQFYYAYRDAGCTFRGPFWVGTPGVGSTHRYEIVQTSGSNWDIVINGSRMATVPLGVSSGYINTGGEVTKLGGSANAMGISGHLNLRYRDSGGTWRSYNGWNQQHVDPGYYLANLGPNAHQTGGNN